MSRPLIDASRLAAGAVALVFAVVSTATCLAAALEMPRAEQHDCCAAMADGCGAATTTLEDCCAAQQPGQNGTVPGASFALAAPAIDSVSLTSRVIEPAVNAAVDPHISHTISQSTYLLDSVFRI